MISINNCVILGLFLNISDHPCLTGRTALRVKNVDFVAKMVVGIPALPFSSYGISSNYFISVSSSGEMKVIMCEGEPMPRPRLSWLT